MFLVALLLLVGLPLLELYVIVRVDEAIGLPLTLVALIASSMLGWRIARAQGRAVLARARLQLAAGRPPAREALDGALIFLGGLLLVVPGFITDVAGAFLLAPPTRALARLLVLRHHGARFLVVLARGRPRPGARPRPADVESTAVEVDRHELPR